MAETCPTGRLHITQKLRDQRSHQRLWITLPRVIQTHHLQPQTCSDQLLQISNFFIPDGSDRHIHQINNKVFHAGYLENGNNA